MAWPRFKKRNKFNAVRTQVEGIWFDSQREARYYQELKLREKAGEIKIVEIHPRYPIAHNGVIICTVVLDFTYIGNDGDWVYVDCKGFDTALSRLKRKLVTAFYGFTVTVVK